MSLASNTVTALRVPHVAPLRNVALLRRTVDELLQRSMNQPGIGVFYGQAGLGKSLAMSAAASAHRAVHVEVRSVHTKKALLLSILGEMGIKPAHTTIELLDQVCEQLQLSKKPLFLDEGDRLITRNLIELVRDIFEGSLCPVVIVGEERFPQNLKRMSERMYDRVLKWLPAERCDLDDARKLAVLYSHDVEIRDELLGLLLQHSAGIARRVAVNIEAVRQRAKKAGKRAIGPDDFDPKGFYTGEAPARRAA